MLHVVATPIGNLGDLSPRALEALKSAALIACEDTRRTWQLLTHFEIPRPAEMFSYRQGNEERVTEKVLSLLASNVLRRKPFKVEVYEEPVSQERMEELEKSLMYAYDVGREEVKYLYNMSTIQKNLYDINDDHITILYKDGTMKDIAEASEILNVELLSKKVKKYFLCYQR